MKEEKSYTSSYLRIYLWQGAAYILQLSTLFFVVPFMSSKPSLYGVYVVCVSISTYLNYGDFGFLSSTQKYAAEAFVKNDRNEESKFLGFGVFILVLVSILFTFSFFYLSLHPEILVKDLDTSLKKNIASDLFLVLCLFTPVSVFKRLINIIYDIRLASHQFQRLFLINNVLSVFSIFYFFSKKNYDIVGYFLFTQLLNLVSVIIATILLKKNHSFNILTVVKNIKFNKSVYLKTNKLAYAGLLGMISWLLFYEIDQVVISKTLGSEKVAIYAIAFTFTVLFRGIFGIVFGPFMVRANYFMGLGKHDELKQFCIKLIKYSASLTIIPTISLSLISRNLILCWVGPGFEESINIARVLSLIFTLSFFTSPVNIYIVVTEKIKESFIIGFFIPVIFWAGVFILLPFLHLFSFAVVKLSVIILIAFFYLYLAKKHMEISVKKLISDISAILLVPFTFILISFFIGSYYLPVEKSKLNLLYVLTFGISITVCSYIIMYFNSKDMREVAKNIFNSLKKNN